MKFLYVEDTPDQLYVVRTILERAGHSVLATDNAIEGLRLADEESPDVILLDIKLKENELDGLALAVQIRAIPKLKHSLILALTAGTVSTKQHLLAAGCDGVLQKEGESFELLKRLQPYLEGRRDPLRPEELLRYTRENGVRFVGQLNERIATLKKRIDDLRTLQGELIRQERLAATGRLALMMAHEISNPLHSIGGSLELVKNPSMPEAERQEYLEVASKAVSHVSGLMNKILNVYTPESEQPSPLDLGALINDVIALISKAAHDSNVVIHRPETDETFIVLAAYASLHQLFLNLLLNALDAMPDGGTLSIQLENMGMDVCVSISDTGVGLLPDAHLFEAFYTTKPDGHGLGLYVCWLIAQANRATLNAFNNPAGGATFTFQLQKEILQ